MKKLILFISLFIFFANGATVFAVDNRVYFQGPTSSIAPQSEFLVSVFLDAKDSVNAFDLEISYPPDKLKFLNFDNTDSIVDIWQASPSVPQNGVIRLSGAILEAFNGSNGLIIKLAFKASSANKAQLSFTKSNLYLADGSGTEIQAKATSFSVSVVENAPVVNSTIVPFESTPLDVAIEQELKTFEAKMLWKEIFTPPLVFPLIFIVLVVVFSAVLVYNKLKRKL